MEIKNKELVELLKDRKKLTKKGFPHFDKIEEIVTKVIEKNISRIASDKDMWAYMKPYIDGKEYKEANALLAEEYRQLQKMEYTMGRLKDKISVILDKEKIELKEFEQIGSVKLAKGKAMVEVIDLVKKYKEMLRERNANK